MTTWTTWRGNKWKWTKSLPSTSTESAASWPHPTTRKARCHSWSCLGSASTNTGGAKSSAKMQTSNIYLILAKSSRLDIEVGPAVGLRHRGVERRAEEFSRAACRALVWVCRTSQRLQVGVCHIAWAVVETIAFAVTWPATVAFAPWPRAILQMVPAVLLVKAKLTTRACWNDVVEFPMNSHRKCR